MYSAARVNELVEGVLDEGLSFVAMHLERNINRPIIFTDSSGQIHYPDINGSRSLIDDTFNQLLSSSMVNEYYYHEEGHTLYYHVGCNGSSGYAVIKNLSPYHMSKAMKCLNDAKLAIKCYFTKINKNRSRFEKAFTDYLLKGKANIGDVIKLSDRSLNLNIPYFISIAQIVDIDCDNSLNLRLLKSYVNDYVIRADADVIAIIYANYLINVVPAFPDNSQEAGRECIVMLDHIQFKQDMEEKFDCRLSYSIGQTYPLQDLHKSFKEALITQTFVQLTGMEHSVQNYTDLGAYYFIFSQDLPSIEKYCARSLGRIIEYDQKNNTELLNTLRTLVDLDFNIKYTAERMYMHVNTLYYRINKIEQLLDTDLSKMNSRAHLFSAIKVWDTLRILSELGKGLALWNE